MATANTLARRKAANERLAPLTSQHAAKLGFMVEHHAALTAQMTTLDYKTTLRLCLYFAKMRAVQLGDSGAITHDVLRHLVVVLAWQVCDASGPEAMHRAINTVCSSLSTPTPPLTPAPTPTPAPSKRKAATPVAAAVQQTTTPQREPDADPIPVMPPPVAASTHHAYASPAMTAYPNGNWQPAAKVFGIRSLKGDVEVFDGSHAATPKMDPDYVWNRDVLQRMIGSVNEDVPTHIWLYGERGTGKSTAAEQFAARVGRPFFKVTFNRYSEPSEIIGQRGLQNGNTEWEDGALLIALRSPVPPIVLLDEICYAQTDAVSGPLNEIVHPLCTYHVPQTGESITFDRRTLFIAADNTNGSGDTTGRYHGARPMNRATVDRFGRFVAVEHMSKAEEVKALMARAVCDKATAEKVSDLMGKLRAKCANGALADPPSLREAIAFARDLRAGLMTPAESFDDTFVGKYPLEAHEELRLTFQSVWVAALGSSTPDNSTPDLP